MSTQNLDGPSIFVRNAHIVMKARKLTIGKWATAAGVSSRALRKYLKQEQTPGLEALSALAQAAGLTVSELTDENLTIELVQSGDLRKIKHAYVAAQPGARQHAQKILTDDLEYQKKLPRPREGKAANT